MDRARLAGLLYLGTFVSGVVAFAAGSTMAVANGVATIFYIGVTVLFYDLFKPVSRPLSAIAALVGGTGCALSLLRVLDVGRVPINELAVFGCYCILVGYLIMRSTFLPRWIGVLLAIGGLSWLTFGWPLLARALAPFNYAPGILAEGLLTGRLLVFGGKPRIEKRI